MADFEDKLNAILSDPESMAQIMQLAQSFASPPPEENAEQSTDSSFFSALGGGIDPGLISKLISKRVLIRGLSPNCFRFCRNTERRKTVTPRGFYPLCSPF